MIAKRLIEWGSSGSTIREIAAYGEARAAQIGAENVFNFTIGSPSVDPPPCVYESVERLMRTLPPTQLHAYAPAPGYESVRQKMAEHLNRSFGAAYRSQDIYMTDGASSALAILTHALLGPGEEALTLTPYFTEYKLYVEAAGGTLREVPSDPETFQIDLGAVERALSPKTALMILNSPNNPSGVVLSRESLTALGRLLEERSRIYGHPIYVIADEPYRELVYGDVEVPFLPLIYRDTIYCYSFSKSLSIPGERVGFLALPPTLTDYENVHAAVYGAGRALGYICVSPLFQLVAAECLGKTADLSVYEKNRNLLYDALQGMGYQCVRPDGAFYLFIRAMEQDAKAFCRRAMEMDLLMVPGDDFGCPGYARIAYCVTTEQIQRSLPVFEKLARSYR